MNPLQRVANWWKGEKIAPGLPAPTGYEAYGVGGSYQFSMSGKRKEYLEEMKGWVGTAVSVISDEVASIELKLYRQTKTGIEEVEDHPIVDLLWRVNEMTTKFDHFWLTQSYLELCGEAPWFLERNGNTIENVYLLNPNRFYPIAGKNSLITRYEYDTGGKRIPLELNEVIFLKYPNPARPFRGLGTLEMAAKTVDIDNASEEWNRKFYENSARPDSVLIAKTDRLKDDSKEKLKQSLKEQYEGTKNAHKVMVLFGDLEFKPTGFNMKDMDFNELSKFNRDKILGMFRVPKAIVSQTEGVNFASADVAQYVFARWTIKPKMERLVQQLNEFLVPQFEDAKDMFIDYENPVPEDEVKKVTKISSGLQNGWLTINEAREEMNLDPVEGGDVIYMPFGLKPLGEPDPELPPLDESAPEETPSDKPEDAPEDKPEDKPEEGKAIYRVAIKATPKKGFKKKIKLSSNNRLHELKARDKEYTRAKRTRESIKQQVKKALWDELKKTGKVTLKSSFKQEGEDVRRVLSEEEVKVFWGEKNKIFNEYLTIIRDAMQRIFVAQRKQTMQKLVAKKEVTYKDSSDDVYEQIKLDIKKEQDRAVKLLLPTIQQLFVESGNRTYELLDLNDRMELTKKINEMLRTSARLFAKGFNETTNEFIKKQVVDSLAKGETINELKNRIKSVFESAEEFRADRIARTETLRYNVQATEQAFMDSGVVESKVWETGPNPCELCVMMAGKVEKLGEVYLEKGESLGDFTADYEEIKGPPLHVNCECDLVPVFKTKKEIEAIRATKDEGEI